MSKNEVVKEFIKRMDKMGLKAPESDRDAYRVDRDLSDDETQLIAHSAQLGRAEVYRTDNQYAKKCCGKCLKPSGRYLRYDLIPFDALREIVEVFTFGEEKHVVKKKGEGQSWKAGVPYSIRINKALRHIVAFVSKKGKDEESGRHALAHSIVQLTLLLAMDLRKGYKQFDDREELTGENNEEKQ